MTGTENKSGARRRKLLAWHRRVGIAAAVIVMVVVVTGIPLNHAEKLGLDRRIVTNGHVIDWYGLEPRGKPVSFRMGAGRLTWLQDSLYLNDRRIAGTAGPVVGAALIGNLYVVATPRELLVYAKDGSLVEKLSGAGIPGKIEAIGVGGDAAIVLRTPAGQFSGTEDFLDWTPNTRAVRWIRPVPIPEDLNAKILKSYRGEGLPWSRLLLDMHTGRILGSLGPYLIDAAALSLLFLVGTGLYQALGRKR